MSLPCENTFFMNAAINTAYNCHKQACLCVEDHPESLGGKKNMLKSYFRCVNKANMHTETQTNTRLWFVVMYMSECISVPLDSEMNYHITSVVIPAFSWNKLQPSIRHGFCCKNNSHFTWARNTSRLDAHFGSSGGCAVRCMWENMIPWQSQGNRSGGCGHRDKQGKNKRWVIILRLSVAYLISFG